MLRARRSSALILLRTAAVTATRLSTITAGMKDLDVIDCHCEGEPARVIVGGLPDIPGDTMVERRQNFMRDFDDYRQLLILEPRGYPCQNADFIVPSTRPDAAFGVVIAEQGFIYPMMSGHNIICVATALLESGKVPMSEPTTEFGLDCPAGLVKIHAECKAGRATRITLHNAPAYCKPADMDVIVDVPTVGKVTVDIAYGGMHYVIVDAASVGLSPLDPSRGKEICKIGEMIKIATREQHPVQHVTHDYPGPDILVFREPAVRKFDEDLGKEVVHAKNTVVMSNGVLDWDKPETWTGMLDRSPCGTGTCAVMAHLHARGELKVGEDFVHESILGTKFIGRLLEETSLQPAEGDPVKAVVPTISGRAWVTQKATVVCDPSDPFPRGYKVGDIW